MNDSEKLKKKWLITQGVDSHLECCGNPRMKAFVTNEFKCNVNRCTTLLQRVGKRRADQKKRENIGLMGNYQAKSKGKKSE
jgi:hypothetical protein